MEVTHEQYQEALKTIRAYAPDVFLNVSPVETKNSTPKSDYLVYHQGYFHICSAITGEIKKANVSLEIIDHCDEPLRAKGEFYLQHGKIISEKKPFVPESVVISRKEYDRLTSNFSGQGTVTVETSYYENIRIKAEMFDALNQYRQYRKKKIVD